MAEKILNTRILLKYDTLAKWEDSKGILRAGEVAIATVPEGSTGQEVGSVKTPQVLVKVGDGKHTFKQLPYITAKAGDVYAWAKAEKLGVAAFGEDVQKLFTDIENDITALEGKVGDSKVGDQISAAITAALKNLANGDAAKAHEFVTAAVQGEDGKVVVSRAALVKEDIPVIDEAQVSGLTTKLGNINTAIEAINNETTGILATAKGYTDAEVKKLADGQVATNKAHIETLMGADTVEGSVAKALKDAKAYAETQASNAETAAKGYADTQAAAAEEAAKNYVDEAIAEITEGETGSLKELAEKVNKNTAAIGTMPTAGEGEEAPTLVGMIAAAEKAADDAIKAEAKRAGDAELALDGRLDIVEAFFAAAEIGGDKVIDTLKEIQEYIESDETGAAEMLASIKANTDALGVINSTDVTKEGSLAKVIDDAAKDVDNEETRAKGEEARIEGLANAAQGAADKAQGEIDALEKVVGTPDQGKTIVEMIAAAQTAATYDDTEVRGLIAGNTTAIGNEVTNREAAVNAVKGEIGVDTQGNYVALTGGHATLIAAINAANAGVATNAGNIKKNADAIAAINDGTTGILATAKGYTDAEIVKVNNAITGLSGEAVKTVEFANKSGKGEKVLGGKIENNKLTVEFDDTLTFILEAGDSTNLDPAQA